MERGDPRRMSTYALTDATTMLRRDFQHLRRYPLMTISGIGTPIVFLLLFNYVLGGAVSAGLGAGLSYINSPLPAILILTPAPASPPTPTPPTIHPPPR